MLCVAGLQTDILSQNSPPAHDSEKRLKYEQWMHFAEASLEVQPWLVLLHSKILDEDKRVNDIVPWALNRHKQMLKVLNHTLEQQEFLLGDEFTTADIMVGTTLMMLPETLSSTPALMQYVKRLEKRSAFQKATQ